ncbi:MAG: hypothetical protein ACTSWY_08630 [Promethearchaeota archaeon]
MDQEWNKGLIKKENQYIRVLGPKERDIEKLQDSFELIDILHYILLLWEKEQNEEITAIIQNSIRNEEILFRTTQAISQSLPNENKEKKLIDGFLSGKERIKNKIIKNKSQVKMDTPLIRYFF